MWEKEKGWRGGGKKGDFCLWVAQGCGCTVAFCPPEGRRDPHTELRSFGEGHWSWLEGAGWSGGCREDGKEKLSLRLLILHKKESLGGHSPAAGLYRARQKSWPLQRVAFRRRLWAAPGRTPFWMSGSSLFTCPPASRPSFGNRGYLSLLPGLGCPSQRTFGL